MYDKGKQIVISSDRRPEDLEALTTEISTAFALGLVVRIDQPDATLRTSILRATARRNKWPIDEAILDYLATHLASDLRTLGGAAKRLVAMKTLSNAAITETTVKEVIAEVTGTAGTTGTLPPSETPRETPPPRTPESPAEVEPSVSPALFVDPLTQEFTPLAPLIKTLTTPHEAAATVESLSAHTVVVLGTSPAVSMDTVDMLAGSRERAVALPEGDDWVYAVRVEEDQPSWLLLAMARWVPDSELNRVFSGKRAPVFLVVLDSLSPRVLEARELIDALPDSCSMAVVVLVPTLANDPAPRTIETLSRSMRRLFRVPPSVPVIMSGRLTTPATRNWLRMIPGAPAS
jgi:hypothetical protein